MERRSVNILYTIKISELSLKSSRDEGEIERDLVSRFLRSTKLHVRDKLFLSKSKLTVLTLHWNVRDKKPANWIGVISTIKYMQLSEKCTKDNK